MADLKMTEDFKETFINMLSEIPNITAVCKLLRVGYTAVNGARKKDPKFDSSVKEAIECGYDMLEEEARRRAVDGVLEPVFFRGEEVGSIRRYSDQLLSQLLKGYRPKKFNPGANVSIDSGEKVNLTINIGVD